MSPTQDKQDVSFLPEALPACCLILEEDELDAHLYSVVSLLGKSSSSGEIGQMYIIVHQ